MGTPKVHRLDLTEIDEMDECDEGAQLALVWCATHRRHEWHWLSDEEIEAGGETERAF